MPVALGISINGFIIPTYKKHWNLSKKLSGGKRANEALECIGRVSFAVWSQEALSRNGEISDHFREARTGKRSV